MPPRTGRPLKGDTPKNTKLNIRLSESEARLIRYCADKLGTTRTDVIMQGVKLVNDKLDKQ